MVFSVERLKFSVKNTSHFIKGYFSILLSLQLVNFLFNQVLTYLQDIRMSSKEDSYIPAILILAFIGFIAQSVIKVLWVLAACHYFNHKENFASYIRHHLEQSLIESLRSFFKAILYGFLLIIPGIIKMVQYAFVVFVVALEKNYLSGKVDALEQSKKIVHGHFFSILFLIIIFALAFLPFSTSPLIFKAPLTVLVSEICSFFLLAIESIYLYRLYSDLKEKT